MNCLQQRWRDLVGLTLHDHSRMCPGFLHVGSASDIVQPKERDAHDTSPLNRINLPAELPHCARY
jgi:hypothetical protein